MGGPKRPPNSACRRAKSHPARSRVCKLQLGRLLGRILNQLDVSRGGTVRSGYLLMLVANPI